MSPDDLSPCPQCGAAPLDGKTCKDKYGEILALEFQEPAVFGVVHHITVTCYNLQHPDFFSDEAIEWMKTSLRKIIEEGLSPAELRKSAGKRTGEGMNVRRQTAPADVPRRIIWSLTVMDVRADSAEVYVREIRAWAKSILDDLNRDGARRAA